MREEKNMKGREEKVREEREVRKSGIGKGEGRGIRKEEKRVI